LEHPCHEARVLDAHTKPERPHSRHIVHALLELLQNEPSPGFVSGKHVREGFSVVSAPALPGNIAQVRIVMNSVVENRHEALLTDRIPETQLRRNPPIEPVKD